MNYHYNKKMIHQILHLIYIQNLIVILILVIALLNDGRLVSGSSDNLYIIKKNIST